MPEVADVFRRFAGSYLEAHGAAMLPSHRRAIADILACRPFDKLRRGARRTAVGLR